MHNLLQICQFAIVSCFRGWGEAVVVLVRAVGKAAVVLVRAVREAVVEVLLRTVLHLC